YAAKEQGAERSDHESNGKCSEISDELKFLVAGRIEDRSQRRGQTSKNIEVIPLDHRADGGRDDDVPQAFLVRWFKRDCSGLACHSSSMQATIDLFHGQNHGN